MKDLLKGSLILTSSNLFVRVAGHIYRVLMGRMLTPYEFGLLNLALPIQYLVLVLTSSGVAPSVAKFVSEYDARGGVEQGRRVMSSALLFYTVIGVVLSLVLVVLSPAISTYLFHEPRAAMPLKISALSIGFGFAVAAYTGFFQGKRRMDLMAAALAIQQGLRIVFALALVYAGARVVGAILGSTLGFMAAVPVAHLLFTRSQGKFGGYSFSDFKEIFSFSLPISATAFASFALTYMDIILVGFYLTTEQVGIYSAASPTSRLVLAFSTALYATLLPSIAGLKSGERSGEIKRYALSAYKLLLLVFLPLLAFSFLFSNPIITLLFGVSYAAAAAPFRVLMIGSFFFGIFTLNSGIFQGVGLPALPMRILLISAILDVFLNAMLIPRYELMGAAVATSFSMAFAGVASMLLLPKALVSK